MLNIANLGMSRRFCSDCLLSKESARENKIFKPWLTSINVVIMTCLITQFTHSNQLEASINEA